MNQGRMFKVTSGTYSESQPVSFWKMRYEPMKTNMDWEMGDLTLMKLTMIQ